MALYSNFGMVPCCDTESHKKWIPAGVGSTVLVWVPNKLVHTYITQTLCWTAWALVQRMKLQFTQNKHGTQGETLILTIALMESNGLQEMALARNKGATESPG